MADTEKEMSWDEAETIARECVREFKAAEKIHLACLKVRTEADRIAKLKAEQDAVQRDLSAARTRLTETLAKVEAAESDAATRTAAAHARILDAENTAVERVAQVNQQARQAKDELAEAQKVHREGLVHMQREAHQARLRHEAEHRSVMAAYQDEEAKAKADRDKAVAMFKQYIQTVQG